MTAPSGRGFTTLEGWKSGRSGSPTDAGPQLGRPLVDRITGSQIHNLKELRPASTGRTEVRVLFVFDPWRSAILLVGGDKSGAWSAWYRGAIPQAEELYAMYLNEREEGDGKP
ncbi:type II toxin-antitoxin system RelE/ParE family toxin [Myceligenerans xiligouense]|uniref:Phage derived Gp49-like protein DUF891 n=1 Tax=Myceligenerans xiligouense TaxID=253184 RepID=A0A3N4ZGW4_9MICO|nr:type II toxin-antitoxin system RelE/ParE family toxin [Myceligenerans xiligouense]RPF20095.1 phage derived Gp49-like protein DUF891 [Myceligenerans xiligouense]